MGQYKIEITAAGGHGVDRDKKDGEEVDFGAEGHFSPDAIAHRVMKELERFGSQIDSATITHWPGEESEVVDNLFTGIRKGNF